MEQPATPSPRAWPRFIDPRLASEYLLERWGLKYSYATLCKLRSIGGGPLYHKAGAAIRYTPGDLDRWAEGKLGAARSSTSEGA